MKRFVKLLLILFLIINLWSLAPLISFYFKPAPIPYPANEDIASSLEKNKGDQFMFIIFGDTHNGFFACDAATLKVVSWMNNEDRFGDKYKTCPIDFVIHTGDITFRGEGESYARYAKIRGLIKWPVLSAIGNHDKDVDEKLFKKYCGTSEFAFGSRNSYFIFLDNAEGEFSGDQFRWLEDRLKDGAKFEHRFVIMHKSPVNPLQRSWYRIESNPWHRRFMKICEDYRVDMVITGHVHMFSSQKFGGVKYLTSGAGGMPIEIAYSEGGFLHYVVVKVNGPYVSYEVRKIVPPVWEIFTYYIWKELVYYIRSLFWYW